MDDAEAEAAVKQAIDLGYRHFDTAFIYHNEVAVGKAVRAKIKEGVIKREDIFITTKSEKEPRNPQDFDEFDDISIEDTWRQMERCVDEGLVRSIGLSNFNSIQMIRVLNIARIKPVVNEVESHIGLDQQQLEKLCRERSVAVIGYCPLGAPYRVVKLRKEKRILELPEVLEMATKYKKTAAQVALRYVVQSNIIPIPKATSADHLSENLKIFDFELENHEMDVLHKLDKNQRLVTYPLAEEHLDWPFRLSF